MTLLHLVAAFVHALQDTRALAEAREENTRQGWQIEGLQERCERLRARVVELEAFVAAMELSVEEPRR